MTEIISDLETTVTSTDGNEYYVQVAGELLPSGTWEAWLEFVPVDDDLDILLTNTETTQSTRDDVVGWSETLTDTYLQGAFVRAVQAAERRVFREPIAEPAEVQAPFDPFAIPALGKGELRARLRLLTRSELLGIIRAYDLNPAGKSLVRLTDAQLVIFIVTAVDVQSRQRRRQ